MSEPIVTVFEGKFLSLRRAGGWEFAERLGASGVVAIVAVDDHGHVVFTEQYRPPLDASVIELPAGLSGDLTDDAGRPLEESGLDAARRELREETGYEADRWTPLGVAASSAGLTNETVSYYRAAGLRRVDEGGGDGNEQIVVHHVPMVGVDRWLASQIAQGRRVGALVYAGLYLARSTPGGDEPSSTVAPTPADFS